MKFISLVPILLLAFNFSTKANLQYSDSTSELRSIGIKIHPGLLQYHHREMEILREKHVNALDISYIKKGNGEKLWHHAYGYPKYGLTYKLIDLGNPNILGYSHCVYPFITLPVYKNQNIYAGFHIGTGLGYITRTYHRTKNFKNSAISTHLNAYINLGFTGSYKLTETLNFDAGFHLSHFSNGTVKKPNAGLNYTMVSLGLSYAQGKQSISNNHKYSFIDKENRLILAGYGSHKEIKGAGGPKYGVGVFSIEYSRQFKTLWRYGISLDVMNDQSNEFILDYEKVPWDSSWHLFKSGTAITSEFILDRLSAVLYFGGYIYNNARYAGDGHLYQKLALRYRLSNSIWAHLALKTHWFSADYLEIGGAFKVL